MKKAISLVLMVAVLVCLMPTMAFAADNDMPANAKVCMILQSGDTVATVIADEDYKVTATVTGTNVNPTEVKASIEMQNVAGLGVTEPRKAEITLATGITGTSTNVELSSWLPKVFGFAGTTIKANVNDKEFTYTVTGMTKDAAGVYTCTATPADIEAVRTAWQELTQKIDTATQAQDDSKIQIPAGAYVQAGTEKLTFDSACVIDPSSQNGLVGSADAIKAAASLNTAAEAGEKNVVMYAPKGSTLQVGGSSATLKTGVKVLSGVTTPEKMLEKLRTAANDSLYQVAASLVNTFDTMVGNVSGSTLDISLITDTCTITLEDGTTKTTVEKTNGAAIGELAAPTAPEGKKFDGWYNGETKVTADTVVTGDMTLVAKYSDATVTPPSGGGIYVPSTPDPLPPAKTEATAEVNKYVEPTAYDEAEAAEVKAIMDKAAKDIAAAKTVEEVKAIEEAAKAEIDKILTKEEKATIAAVEDSKFKARSKMTTLNGKKAVKVTWNAPKGMKFDGYDIFRSTKRYSGYGNKPFFSTTKMSYINNKDLEEGKTYYYKVRGYKIVNGEKVYSQWSYKAWRTI